MKLCRFELKTEPGVVRSGMVYAGKVYETDGANAIAVHEADAVRPLAPVPQAPSLRIFRNDLQPLNQNDVDEPHFFYGNPASVVGSNQVISYPAFTTVVVAQPYLAAVVLTPGYRIDVSQAEGTILGLTLLCLLTSPRTEEAERRAGGGFGQSQDLGAALGPVLTTPEELDDFLVDQEFGRRYGLNGLTRVNRVERDRGNVQDLPWTFAEAISAASQSSTIREGDIFAFGPVVDTDDPYLMQPGDEFQFSVENLGTLSLKLSEIL
ncbi:MAG TPA: fumarylacetoacetate hydrolase family protein [Fimbriimonas sp.]|nr:fumarylacetoacetate hydrolase family protein [Fimbriimonas sp.]